MAAIARGVSLALLIFFPLLFLATRLAAIPRSALIIEWPLLIAMLAVPRLFYRTYKDGNLRLLFDRRAEDRVPVLLIGAGPEAETFLREMTRQRNAPYRVVGLVDDSEANLGRSLRGVRVMGRIGDLADVLAELRRRNRAPQRLVITKGQAAGREVRALLDEADRLGLPLSRLPRLTEFREGEGRETEVRPIAVEDLLGRPQRVLDRAARERLIAGRRVLVTGAGGTIGSELCRQIAELKPARLVLFDNGEYNLYRIDRELGQGHPGVIRVAALGDVRDERRLTALFHAERPELIFHAAAFKHVPMVESNVTEGVLTNVQGTRNVADLARRTGAAEMVLISTDKAVNPTSVMGASKRVCELYCQAQAGRAVSDPGGTRFVTVRFGNVLGSTGSVVPLFQEQLRQGGPLTVTDPDITRFFMTTREAVELTLQASAMPTPADDGRGIFVLDMGEPVKIRDLAHQMIRLAGLRPEADIRIVYTGLRPGEKLHEELFLSHETPRATEAEGVFRATPAAIDHAILAPLVDQMLAAAEAGREEDVLALLHRLVPEFTAPRPQAAASGG
jgi:O-antigen biosynthesis protein WbqV